jgi:hypothetical protein
MRGVPPLALAQRAKVLWPVESSWSLSDPKSVE